LRIERVLHEHRGDVPQIPPIVFGPHAGGFDREWLVPDGLGGYAAGTASGLRTRPGHGLLTVAGRLAVAALDLTVTLPSGAKVPLYTHRWAGDVTDPEGHLLLETFALVDGLPRWRWRIGDVVVERELAMRHGHPSVAVRHRVVSAPGPVGLAVAAMCTWRAADGVRLASGPAIKAEQVSGGVVVEDAYRIDGPGWQPGGEWHLDARTDAGDEDLWLAGTYFQRVNSGGVVEISAWAGDLGTPPPPAATVIAAAGERNRRLAAGAADGVTATLRLAADAFVIRAADGPDLISGYPGAADRDTMAAYEGVFLATGRADEGREFLRARLRDDESPLWLVHAVDRHVARTGDIDLAAELAAPLGRLLRRALAERVDPADELVRIDAGKPVAVNALWVNALAALADLLTAAGRDDAEPRARHERARRSFEERFPAPEGWLHDVVEGPPAAYPLGAGTQHDDPTLRPHQLLAWSLPHAPLPPDASALRAIGPSLLTPLGLRTLAPSEYGYQPTTADGHVLPWLIGPWADACAAAGLPVDGLLTGLAAQLGESGLGSVSESAHGDPPHRGTGTPFSARSVAEVLRVRERHT
jgi:glycogen debranching enzyme